MKKFRAAVFDMDGTILDTMYIWSNLSSEFLKQRGIEPPADLNERLGIMGMRSAVKYLLENFDLKCSFNEAQREMQGFLKSYYRANSEYKPGAERLLKVLEKLNITRVLLTATPSVCAAAALDKVNALPLLDAGIISVSDLGISKADPETFFAAIRQLGVENDEVIVFEDAFYAVSTAKKAGLKVACINDRWEKRGKELAALADWYVESWDEFTDLLENR